MEHRFKALIFDVMNLRYPEGSRKQYPEGSRKQEGYDGPGIVLVWKRQERIRKPLGKESL
jgi:hypothetical protein